MSNVIPIIGKHGFPAVLTAVQLGQHARRKVWPKGAFIYSTAVLVSVGAEEAQQLRPCLALIRPEMGGSAGLSVWTPSQADLFASDWKINLPPKDWKDPNVAANNQVERKPN